MTWAYSGVATCSVPSAANSRLLSSTRAGSSSAES
ncbi:Uncharacterised protein [Bordetella pertussis]|nr:Uncharacterised protein [Bordetella pertussis]CFO93407.1 Uncharacterised protein [Bordetella pertussis]CFT92864.1 Uncharacterised protein [Bordetella pertussis]CFW00914.1 Uncharacterised protein [Bordetella pertussis]CPH56583.1 Uncharacterised protein [Bordetella pertussis]